VYAVNKKILVSRTDHEVYFIPFSEDIKPRDLHAFIGDKLAEQHPGFSAASVYDLQKVTVEGRRWMMATVMEREKLTEYRLTHPGSLLYTATGVLIRQPEFSHRGMAVINGETIGYDAEKGVPVSIPIGEAAVEVGVEAESARELTRLLPKTPVRYRVFKRPVPRFLLALPLAPLLIVLGILFVRYFSFARQEPEKDKLEVTAVSAPVQEAPSALAMFAEIADAVQEMRGLIQHWQYTESAEPAFIIQLAGLDAHKLYGLLSQFEYAAIRDVSNIRYLEGIPHYTARISLNSQNYHIPTEMGFSTQEEALVMLATLREQVEGSRVQIVSESPPPGGADGSCAMVLEAEGLDFIETLETIEQTFDTHELRIRSMTVALDQERGVFMFSCSFAPYQKGVPVLLGEKKAAIPAAFGYSGRMPVVPLKPLPPATEPEVAQEPEAPERGAYVQLGIIKGEGEKIIRFYKNPEGKIVREEE
jgi:hypothetical protein